MDWQQTLRGKDWQAATGAQKASVRALIAASENALPADYLDFLSFSNGGQGELAEQPLWLVLHDAEFVTNLLKDPTRKDYFPGFVQIGSNGAGEAIAFDFRPDSAGGIVYFDMVNSDLPESVVPLAASFTQLMAFLLPRVA
ncbi:MAG: hypothetical protein RLZZ437_1838 [Pseudomonadota bacterium]